MGHCLAHHETRYWFSWIYLWEKSSTVYLIVYAEHFKFKDTKEFRKQRAEDYKKQAEDPAAQFSVLVRAKTAKKKIATVIKPEDILHFQQALNKILRGNLLKNVESKKEVVKGKKKRSQAQAAEGKEEQKETANGVKKFKSK